MFICLYRLVISQQSRASHLVFPHQFLDSPEWFMVSTDDFFQVIFLYATTLIRGPYLVISPEFGFFRDVASLKVLGGGRILRIYRQELA